MRSCREGIPYEANPYAGAVLCRPDDEAGSGAFFHAVGPCPVVLAIVVQMAVTMVLHGRVESIDVIRSIFFGLLITPGSLLLSVVVEQLEESRQRLSRLVENWRRCASATCSNVQLKDNIAQLNQEIGEREKAEAERETTLEQLKIEMKEREETQIQLEQQSSFLRSFLDASPDRYSIAMKTKSFLAVTGRWNY